ncbi:Hypothetical predicted protein [Octopus vulgaris]|uniref:Uncharacterized protein n=1 Tax=Octopus vulgaris TaxID=6645 RepID=A0AA36AL05_OCTVU|nr:Hypothetical predicted protein [Octopus vulgaris]
MLQSNISIDCGIMKSYMRHNVLYQIVKDSNTSVIIHNVTNCNANDQGGIVHGSEDVVFDISQGTFFKYFSDSKFFSS